ncbi:Homeobox-leucine zipper protein HAT14 [Striga hermonthica]|uniref:Homeobox-leucine zipper protein HAT14 n=1 Tax=Striga hermonthica TaxID=68872 RepID=A0A9N7NKM4_STRHE|nr:Homeobox-leucine zipper protein HAT14 [Striga hermonthica]
MELALSLGDTPKAFSFMEKSQQILGKDLGFCMATDHEDAAGKAKTTGRDKDPGFSDGSSSDPAPVQLDLLPFSPVHKTQPPSNNFPFNWLHTKSCKQTNNKGVDPISSFRMDFSIFGSDSNRGKRDLEQMNSSAGEQAEPEADRGTPSRGSDEEENGLLMGRKKLRLSKEQSAFLEESFKEHNTLNPKQKLALAKQLNLRPRQVEVWFQNRRARTKLKQTEVDCEYLKKCCETLTEENRRLQKELQELRALKATQPFYMQLPATTLTMCPSCERVATATTATTAGHNNLLSANDKAQQAAS